VPELQVPCDELDGDDVEEDLVVPGGSRAVHLPSLQPLEVQGGDRQLDPAGGPA
jgi:hypothetical protein